MRTFVLAITTAFIAAVLSPLFPLPAQGCSCAIPGDVRSWVDQSEAAMVGRLLERRDLPEPGEYGPETVYVFEVERWVKGDHGDVIEVRSASDGAGCGFEFWDEDMRVGAILHLDDGELRGGLCAQVDPDVLIAAMTGLDPSQTGAGFLLVGGGWSSERLTVLDDAGGLVVEASPPSVGEYSGTRQLVACPGERFALQLTVSSVEVWDLTGVSHVRSQQLADNEWTTWPAAVSCRSEDASTVWVVMQSESGAVLTDLATRDEILPLPGTSWKFGTDFVVAQEDGEDDPIRIEIPSGEQTLLHETPPGSLWAIYPAPSSVDGRVALVTTRYPSRDGDTSEIEATLSVLDESGGELDRYDIRWEASSPTWLDESRIFVQAYDWGDERVAQSFGVVIDVASGETWELPDWDATHVVATGDTLYGVSGGDVVTADIRSGDLAILVTLPVEFAGPLLLLEDEPMVTTTTAASPGTSGPVPSTTPPLIIPDSSGAGGSSVTVAEWLAVSALVISVVALTWLALRNQVTRSPS